MSQEELPDLSQEASKWNQVQSLLAKRMDQLEIVTGDTASFQETLEGLLSWLGESLRSDGFYKVFDMSAA